MDISGNYTLYAPREVVWNALLDPETLKRTVPGCESLEQTGENEYAVRMNVGVAGVKGSYDGTLRVLDAQKPESYRMVVDGTGARGILHGDGTLHLEAKDAGTTVVRYTGQAQIGGAIASVGMRVAGGAANMLIKQYFVRLADLLPSIPAASEATSEAPAAPAATMAATDTVATSDTAAAMANEPAAPEAASPEVSQPEPPHVEQAAASESMPAATDAPVLVNPGMSGVSSGMMPTAGDDAGAQSSLADAAPSEDVTAVPELPVEPPSTPAPEPVAAPEPTPAPAAESVPMPVDAMMPPPTAPIHPPASAMSQPARTPLVNFARRAGLGDGSIESEQRWAQIIGIVLFVAVLVVVLLIVWLFIRQ
jgi:uncharacterized protein